MPARSSTAKGLLDRAGKAVKKARTLDKALAALSGVLFPTFPFRRSTLSVLIAPDRLVIAGLWTAQPTRMIKGTVLRVTTTVFPEILAKSETIMSEDAEDSLYAQALAQEQLNAWVVVPVPTPREAAGLLSFAARTNVFSGHREFFSLVGLTVGKRLLQLSRESTAYMHARESVITLDRSMEIIQNP